MVYAAIIFLVFCAICALMESRTTGLFKTFGVYGRFSAYLGLFCPLGLGMFVASFFKEGEGFDFPHNLVYLLIAAVGALFYFFAYIKCPKFLKKKCIPYMFISGMGLCLKICFFFFTFVWKIVGPQEMVDNSGRTVYVYSGDVYDANGKKVGTASADRKSYVPDKE